MSTSRAQQLRATPTDAEIRLWSRRRGKQIEGFRFRRQQPIGPYIADFFCPAAKLVVEVGGGQHGEREREDAARSRWIEERGYRVLRSGNSEVLANTDGVVTAILAALRRCPPPLPPPQGGRGNEVCLRLYSGNFDASALPRE